MSKEVATLDQFSVPSVIATIEAQIKELGKIETSKFKTSMRLNPFGDLKQVKDVETLVKAFSLIEGKAERYNQAAKALEVDGSVKAFSEEGNSLQEWKEDISLQIAILTHGEKLKELKRLRDAAKAFISEEDKKRMFFEELMSNPILGTKK